MYDKVIEALNDKIHGRRKELAIALTAYIAKQNVILAGKPGTAKSLISQTLCRVIPERKVFNIQFTPFTEKDDLIGPIDIAKMRDDGSRTRKTDGYLPTSEIAVLDEIFKARGPALNTLLSLLNERTFMEEGKITQSDLKWVIASANKLESDDDTRALDDRFTVGCVVETLGAKLIGAEEMWKTEDTKMPRMKQIRVDQTRGMAKEILKKWGKNIIKQVVKINKSALNYGSKGLSDRSILKACELVASSHAMTLLTHNLALTEPSIDSYYILAYAGPLQEQAIWEASLNKHLREISELFKTGSGIKEQQAIIEEIKNAKINFMYQQALINTLELSIYDQRSY